MHSYGEISIFRFNETQKNNTEYYKEIMNKFKEMDLTNTEGAGTATSILYYLINNLAQNFFTNKFALDNERGFNLRALLGYLERKDYNNNKIDLNLKKWLDVLGIT